MNEHRFLFLFLADVDHISTKMERKVFILIIFSLLKITEQAGDTTIKVKVGKHFEQIHTFLRSGGDS